MIWAALIALWILAIALWVVALRLWKECRQLRAENDAMMLRPERSKARR